MNIKAHSVLSSLFTGGKQRKRGKKWNSKLWASGCTSLCVFVPLLAHFLSGGVPVMGDNITFSSCPSFCVGPPVYSQSCSHPSTMLCSTASTPAATWRGCAIGIPGALSPLMMGFWWGGELWISGCRTAVGGSAGPGAPAGAGHPKGFCRT